MLIAIVGGGVIGLLTAVDLVASGHRVVIVDQGDIPFPGAASFDRHRVIRALHLTDPTASAAAAQAHHRWIALQHQLSAAFYEQVGALTVLRSDQVAAARTMLTAAGSRALVLDSEELASSYWHLGFPVGASAVFESHAGVLLADRVLAACVSWLRRNAAAELRPYQKAVGVDVDGRSVRLVDGDVLSADALLLAAGPWSREFLATELADQLVLHRQSMLYCTVPAADAGAWSATPAVPSLGTDGGAWLVPPVAGTPLKLSAASACRVVSEVGDTTTPPSWRDHLVESFAAVIPGFHADWLTGSRDCYYLSRASTGGPMVVELADRVVAYAACGGSSFKFAPLIARSLAERLTGADPAPTGLDPVDGGIVRAAPGPAADRPQARPVMRGVS